VDEFGQFVFADLGEFYADPTFYAYVGRFEVDFRGFGDHGGLRADGDGYPDGGVAVAVVVVGDHDEDSFGYEEGGFAVGELFGGAGLGEGQLADSIDLGFGGDGHVVFSTDSWLPLFQVWRGEEPKGARG
jgi:hypothetical protein